MDLSGGRQHAETLSGIIYSDLFYIVFGAPSWLLIDILASMGSLKNAIVIRFFLGLIVLNVLVVIAANFIPLLTLLSADTTAPNFKTSAFILVVYLISFMIGSLAFINQKRSSENR